MFHLLEVQSSHVLGRVKVFMLGKGENGFLTDGKLDLLLEVPAIKNYEKPVVVHDVAPCCWRRDIYVLKLVHVFSSSAFQHVHRFCCQVQDAANGKRCRVALVA